MNESLNGNQLQGYIRIYEQGNPKNTIYSDKNVITLGTKYLFARLLANPSEPRYGIWGLAVGAGAPDWPANNQPDALATQQSIITPILRKPIQSARFVDTSFNTIPNDGFSNIVDFQTILNATTDGIVTPIRELGLIAGGSSADATVMATAPFFDSGSQAGIDNVDSVILFNYKTLPPLQLPEGINFTLSWLINC